MIMMYKVICAFNDRTDSNLLYKVGDVYPRAGTHPTDERIAELLSDANMQHKPLIVKSNSEDEQPTPPKRKRGKRNENN
jgi:hypothetical protein